MSRMFPVILLSLAILFRVVCELSLPNGAGSDIIYSNIYPFLEKWSKTSHTKLLTVVYDDYDDHSAFDVPRGVSVRLNVSTKLISLKHLISLKYKDVRQNYHTIETESCVLLLFSSVDHLRYILSSPYLTTFWHPENFYILQEQRRRAINLPEHERFCKWAFEKLWRFRRVYKLLFFANDKTIRHDPFDYAARHISHYVNTNCDWHCIKSQEDDFLLISEPNDTDISGMFVEDRRDFKLFPLKISIFETSTMIFQNGYFSGLDFNYLEEVCRMMNVTYVLIRSKDKFGWQEKGAFFGTIGHLVYGFADVSFNEFFVKDYSTRQLEFTTSITSDKLCVLVPKAPPVPDYLVMVKIFTGKAWLLVFATHFVISMIYTILKNKRNQKIFAAIRQGGRAFFCCEYPVDTYFLEEIVPKMTEKALHGKVYGYPRLANGICLFEKKQNIWPIIKTRKDNSKRFNRVFLSFLKSFGRYFSKVVFQLMQPFKLGQPWFPERLLLMCSLLLSLILNGIITSQLASSFSKRIYYEDIDSLEQLEESGLTILTDAKDVISDAFTDVTSPLIKRLNKRLEYANNTEVNRRLFETKDAGYLHRFSTLSLKYNENQRERLHVVKECPKEYILAIIMTKGSPYSGRINKILSRLNNGGFYGKWYQSMYHLQKRPEQVTNGSTLHRRITIRHLFIPFGILYVGLTTSIIVFIYEWQQNNDFDN